MTPLKIKESEKRYFSEFQHKTGNWNTKIALKNNKAFRFLWNFLSFKRNGVDRLRRMSRNKKLVLELGSGNGAYSHWYLTKKSNDCVIAVDWSFFALKQMTLSPHYSIHKVCADIHHLPFKSNSFNKLFSIDTLGHVSNIEQVLDEILRVTSKGCNMFIHSECNDYQKRWPDSLLININKKDIIANLDGHYTLHSSNHLKHLYRQRFKVTKFYSPAGVLGWLIGYPEKYCFAFKNSNMIIYAILVKFFSYIKKTPILGVIMRLVNSLTNHIEITIGLHGGGSCFAFLKKSDE